VFFYANCSNPVTGDNYKYLLLGAGLLRGVSKPKEYNIPKNLLQDVRAKPRMKNFPTIVWQFQIILDSDSVFVLPYHEYLK
jgi:exodeoxyribonuclease V alpha subunit